MAVFSGCAGAALIAVAWWNPAGWLGLPQLQECMVRGQYGARWCGADAGTESQNSRTQTTDNGKQNTYFSSLDNMVARAMFCRFCTVKCAWGHG